jgi:hypothetical protein
MNVHFVSARTVGWILFLFGVLQFINHRSVPGEYEQSNSKNKGPQHIIAIISKRAVTVLVNTIGLIKSAGENNGTPCSGPNAKCNFILKGRDRF